MTDEQLNKRLHEIMSVCGHDNWRYSIPDVADLVNTWQCFGILWEFMQKHEQWENFISKQIWVSISDRKINKLSGIFTKLISLPAFAKAVVEFFEEKK